MRERPGAPTATIVFDLGPGDGGKGGVVYSLACAQDAGAILKVGGAQGSHGVQTAAGQKFAFSQWGCGTFAGIPTHLTARFVCSPEGLLNEAAALQAAGVAEPFRLLTADETVLCATPFQGCLSRLRELACGDNPRGTTGSGVGVAVRMADDKQLPTALYLSDLLGGEAWLRERLQCNFDRCRELAAGMDNLCDYRPVDRELAAAELDLLADDDWLEHVLQRFQACGDQLRIVNETDFLPACVFSQNRPVIVESSHGVLTDADRGLRPHVSALRTLPVFAYQHLLDCGWDGAIKLLAVHRAYSIRHGAGPLPTYDPEFTAQLLPHSTKLVNRYQGAARAGPLDLVLLRYALQLADHPHLPPPELALTWCDQVLQQHQWAYCNWYRAGPDPAFPVVGQIAWWFYHVQPEIVRFAGLYSADAVTRLLADTVQRTLGVRVAQLSYGPTPADVVHCESETEVEDAVV